ncbi:RHS repeat domain-containing protein [Empedobacter tilapiae]
MSYQKEANGSLKVLEENNYYPFGLKHSGYNNTNLANANYKYKYNGQELQDELGLNWTAMDFRNYDASIGRFHNMDPLSEVAQEWTPYRFAYNNPIYYKDPSGMIEFQYDSNDGVTGFSTNNTEEIKQILNYLTEFKGTSFDEVEKYVWNDMHYNESSVFSLDLGEATVKNQSKNEQMFNGFKTEITDKFNAQLEAAQISGNVLVNGFYGAFAYIYYSIKLGDDNAARFKVNTQLDPIIPTKSYGFRKGKLTEINWGNMTEQQQIDYIYALALKNGTMVIPSIKIFDKLPNKVNDIIQGELLKNIEKDVLEGGRYSLD